MTLWNRAIAALDRLSAPAAVSAHCDVPCGIYDPKAAQTAAETVLAMITKMQALTPPGADADQATQQAYTNTITRMITTKEEHAERVKHEITVLWADYFKPPHVQQFPNMHEYVWNTLKTASATKQTVDLEAAQKLQQMVNQIADWFWETKK